MPVQVPTPDELAQVDTRARAAQDAAATAQNTATDALAGSARATAATTALAAEVAALTARVAKLEQPTTPPPPTPERFEAIDFAAGNAGHWKNPGNLVGKGSAVTTYAVKAGSSTKTPPTTGTNPLRVVRVGATGGTLQAGVKVQGVTVEGYAGHNTHGITVGYVDGAQLRDVRAVGVKGSGSSPPAETFAIEVWQALNVTVDDCTVDGQNVSATLFGLNSVDGVVVSKLKANGTAVAFGTATWQCGNVTYRDCDLRGNRRAMNFEQCYGNILIERVDLRGRLSARTTGPDIVVATAGYTPGRGPLAGQRQTSAKVRIVDPVWDRDKGPLIVGIPTLGGNYPAGGGPHTQRVEDVTVVIDGREYVGAQNNAVVKVGNYWSG